MDTVSNKRALVIVAHDDDDCAMAGTIARLTKNGWRIMQISLTQHKMEGQTRNPAHLICLGNKRLISDGFYRIGLDTMKNPYVPITYDQFTQQFLMEKIATAISTTVNAYKPSVIFTLDNIKGGFGHPEHHLQLEGLS